MTSITADICIVGGGPAGSVLAVRLAQLGFDVCLVERAPFPRRHLGESLSPGVLPLLGAIGVDMAIASAGFTPVRTVEVAWDRGPQQRHDPSGRGLLVDRARFDHLLLKHARHCGVRVLQPARIVDKVLGVDGWQLRIAAGDRSFSLRAGFLADASGRAALQRSRRRPTGCRTVALHAYWSGRDLPVQPRIEAGQAEWYWGVPLPDGSYNTLVFIDAARFRHDRTDLVGAGFRELITRSGLLVGCADARMISRVVTSDATAYLDGECASARSIKVGDAALALDPLSSSGVQKAIQTSLSGAVVVNTLLRRPESQQAALRFYQDSLDQASERHRRWAADHYATVAAQREGDFWRTRADLGMSGSRLPFREVTRHAAADDVPLALSREVSFVEVPCLDGDFVQLKPAIQHPNLESPVAYLGDCAVVPLLERSRVGMSALELALAWSPEIPLAKARDISRWLVQRGILTPVSAVKRRSAA